MGCISAKSKAERHDGLAGTSIAMATVNAYTSVACVAPVNEYLAVSKNSIELDYQGTAQSFDITSNTSWTIL